MVPFLLVNFYNFLKCNRWYFALFWNSAIFGGNFHHSLEWYHFFSLIFSTRLECYYFCRGGAIFIILWTSTIIVADFKHSPGMVPLLSQIFDTLLDWYHFRFRFSVHFSNGTIFVSDFSHFAQIVPYCGSQNFSHCTRMVPFLLLNFGTFLKWYHFCLWFSALFSNCTIFVAEF